VQPNDQETVELVAATEAKVQQIVADSPAKEKQPDTVTIRLPGAPAPAAAPEAKPAELAGVALSRRSRK
jgi:hypothetical protein